MTTLPPLYLLFQISMYMAISFVVVFSIIVFALWGLWYGGVIATYEPLLGHAVVSSVVAGAAMVYLSYLMAKDDTEFIVVLRDERGQ